MKVELVPPDSDTAPRHWVRHDQAFAMMLGPGSIERSAVAEAFPRCRSLRPQPGAARRAFGSMRRAHGQQVSGSSF